VPFAADFVLLRENQQWINERRFPRSRMPDYYRECFGSSSDTPRIQVMYPGDVLLDSQLLPRSPYRSRLSAGGLGPLIKEQYGNEIASLKEEKWISDAEVQAIERDLCKT
jgi:hypothetical protein